MTAVRSSACLAGGLGLLLTLAVAPFVAREGQTFGFGGGGMGPTALALSARFPGFWLLAALAVVWVGWGLVGRERLDRPAVWGGTVGYEVLTRLGRRYHRVWKR